MGDQAVDIEDVHLTLVSANGPVPILKGIDLRVKTGEAVALVGPSGSGKSSLISVIAGLEAPTMGRCTVAGQLLNGLSEDALARFRSSHIGIVFQSFHLIPSMTAHENVAVALEFAGDDNSLKAAETLLRRTGLGARLDHYPAQLSGGEQQRVAIARALANRPKLLLADEPTGNLDHETGLTISDLLFEMHRQSGNSMVLVTHDAELAQRCDRIFFIRDGAITPGHTSPLPTDHPRDGLISLKAAP